MRVALVLACLCCCAAVTLLAVEPKPREGEEVATAGGENLSSLPRAAELPPEDLLEFPAEIESQPMAEHYRELGVAAFAAALKNPKEMDRAIDLLERAVVADPDNSANKLDLADAYMFLGDDVAVAAAADLYEEVLNNQPDNDRLLGRLALAYLQLGNDDAAFKILARRATGEKADLRATALQLAATALESGDIHRAAEEAAKIVQNHPDEPFVRLIFAMLLSDAGRDADALQHVEKLIAEQPAGSALSDAAVELKGRIGR